eukprot:m.5379 g.5379  ORF g.5379 m.5379 type:complete len:767 (-) comp3289_c0_seq2:34-2334(-)
MESKMDGAPSRDTSSASTTSVGSLGVFEVMERPLLQRFNETKEAITAAVSELLGLLSETTSLMQTPITWVEHSPTGQTIVREDTLEEERVTAASASERANWVLEAVSRDTMKVVFIGRTSNGKSTTVNAMLHRNILPSGLGHTTNCFCRVHGTEEAEPYMQFGSDQARQKIENIKQLAHALFPEKSVESDSFVDVYWPRERCPLLYHGVEIIDSPGLDLNADFDTWIDQFCCDADVFVLVANAESSLNLTEKNFFRRVKQKISSPNVFVCFNRWDQVQDNEDETDSPASMVKEQHMVNAKSLMEDDLGYVPGTVPAPPPLEDRVFFISSREALKRRTNVSSRIFNKENAAKRLKEFARFETAFEDCISTSAMNTRFASHIGTGCELAQTMSNTLKATLQKAQARREQVENYNSIQKAQLEKIRAKRIQEELQCRQTIKSASTTVSKTISNILFNESANIVNGSVGQFRDKENSFDIKSPWAFTRNLSSHVEAKLHAALDTRCTNLIQETHDATHNDIRERITDLVPTALLPAVLTNDHPHFKARFYLNCNGLVETFSPDLRFQFSLGFPTLKQAVQTLNMQMPWDKAAGAVVKSFSEDHDVDVAELALSVLKSPVTIATIVSTCLSRSFTRKLFMYACMLYGTLYMYEWMTYTQAAQIRRLKQQFVEHTMKEMENIARHASFHCEQDLENTLSSALDTVFKRIDSIDNQLLSGIREIQNDLTNLDTTTDKLSQLMTGFEEENHLFCELKERMATPHSNDESFYESQ